MKFLVWLLLIIIGFQVMRYRYMIYNFTGSWPWADRFLGSNGTVVAIILFGGILIFIGVAYPLGAFSQLVNEVPKSATGTQSVFQNR